MDAEERTWLARYRAGDAEALGALVEHHRRPLYAYIAGMTGAGAEADDVFQETWMRAIRRLPVFRPDNLRGWLMRIARNLVIDRARRRGPALSLDADGAGGGDWHERVADPGPSPLERAAAGDERRRVAAAVAGLPAEQREVFVMRTEGGLPFKEIARVQGVSINTALARMQYALGKLRNALETQGEADR